MKIMVFVFSIVMQKAYNKLNTVSREQFNSCWPTLGDQYGNLIEFCVN